MLFGESLSLENPRHFQKELKVVADGPEPALNRAQGPVL